jgi:hypothetical protein
MHRLLNRNSLCRHTSAFFLHRILLTTPLVKQCLGVFEVGTVEAFGERVVDVGENRERLVAAPLGCEQAREADRRDGPGPQSQ